MAAAYIPFKTLITATDALKEGIPPQLDRSAWPTLASGTRSWTMSALRFLGFIDHEGNPQPDLESWVHGDDATRRGILNRILREKYSEVVALTERNGTTKQMQDAFDRLGVTGSTKARAISFFIKAAAFAEMQLPSAWKKARTQVGNSGRKRRQAQGGGEPEVPVTHARAEGRTVELQSGGTVTLTIEADPWAVSPEDREWLFNLVDQIAEYEATEDEPDGEESV